MNFNDLLAMLGGMSQQGFGAQTLPGQAPQMTSPGGTGPLMTPPPLPPMSQRSAPSLGGQGPLGSNPSDPSYGYGGYGQGATQAAPTTNPDGSLTIHQDPNAPNPGAQQGQHPWMGILQQLLQGAARGAGASMQGRPAPQQPGLQMGPSSAAAAQQGGFPWWLLLNRPQ